MMKFIGYTEAIRLLTEEGATLVETIVPRTEVKSGKTYVLVGCPGCGPVTVLTARRIIALKKCTPVDPGLFPGTAQTFQMQT